MKPLSRGGFPQTERISEVPNSFVHTYIHMHFVFLGLHESPIHSRLCRALKQMRLCKVPRGFTKPLYRGCFVKPQWTLKSPYIEEAFQRPYKEETLQIIQGLHDIPIQRMSCNVPTEKRLCKTTRGLIKPPYNRGFTKAPRGSMGTRVSSSLYMEGGFINPLGVS